jgi:hypothetical protein
MTNNDKIADYLTKGIAATIGASILATPFFGFTPVIAACTGLVIACVVFSWWTSPKAKANAQRTDAGSGRTSHMASSRDLST